MFCFRINVFNPLNGCCFVELVFCCVCLVDFVVICGDAEDSFLFFVPSGKDDEDSFLFFVLSRKDAKDVFFSLIFFVKIDLSSLSFVSVQGVLLNIID